MLTEGPARVNEALTVRGLEAILAAARMTRSRSRIVALAVAVAATCLLGAVTPRPATGDRIADAKACYDRGIQHLARGTFDSRRLAIQEFEQATLLDPRNAEYQLTLARTYYRVGFLKNARQRFEKVVRLMPKDAPGRRGLGQVWKRDWLKYLDVTSLQRAVDHLSMAARLEPASADAWLMLVPLMVEMDDLRGAYDAATKSLSADPRRADALLAVGYTSYRMGYVARAESAYAAAAPWLPHSVRERIDDISPVASERDTFVLRRLKPDDQAEFVRRFWKDLDPDLATPENEAQLEYWSRVAHAYFLFFDPRRREWDERGEVYVRYGPPGRARYNPLGASYLDWGNTPRNVLLWEYPELGMRVILEDRLLSERYLFAIMRENDPGPVPDPAMIDVLNNRVVSSGGRGVFPMLPPGVVPIAIDGAVARFEGESGPRILAQVEVPGGPADSLWAEWVVLDSTRREVERGARALAPSACGALERRVADFATELPAGEYLVGLTVRGSDGRRGVYREPIQIRPPSQSLSLSDVVIACGAPMIPTGPAPVVQIEPNPAARVNPNDPLTAYFEIYHLTPGEDGQSRFAYVYVVRSAERDPRIWLQRLFSPRAKPSPIEVSREDENPGSLRRQFVTVPIQSLPAGKYQLEIRVRDLVVGSEVVRSALFVKTG